MIKFVPGEYSQVEWGQLAERAESQNLMQCWAYGEAKRIADSWRVERGVFTDGDTIVGIAQAMIRDLPGIGSLVRGGLCWVNRGPLLFDARLQGDALAALNIYYVVERGCYLRIAPPNGAPAGEGAAPAQTGFQETGTPGWASATLALAPDAERLRKSLRQNWRNALNKAARAAIRVEPCPDENSFAGFLDEYDGFLRTRGFSTTVTSALLRALFRAAGPSGRMMCYRGVDGETPLGSVVTIRYGDTVEYLAGTVLDAGRPLSVGQHLLWHAVCQAKEAGATQFDLGGMDPDLTPRGIYDFKDGLGGSPYRLADEIEAVGGGLRAALVRWRVRRSRQTMA
jgi:peptidoglycan pentaglycine glycine transferase (the first glycine)